MRVARPGDVIVEFGAGGGHLGLVLAHMLPACRVVLLDRKLMSVARRVMLTARDAQSSPRAVSRAEAAGLRNVCAYVGDMQDFQMAYDIGVALHFCGILTDMALQHCARHRAAFVLSPCCYGKVGANWDASGEIVAFPRSDFFKTELGISSDEVSRNVSAACVMIAQHLVLAAAADFSPMQLDDGSEQFDTESEAYCSAKYCMGVVDSDRLAWAAQAVRAPPPAPAHTRRRRTADIRPGGSPCIRQAAHRKAASSWACLWAARTRAPASPNSTLRRRNPSKHFPSHVCVLSRGQHQHFT